MRPVELCAPERMSGSGVAHGGTFPKLAGGGVAECYRDDVSGATEEGSPRRYVERELVEGEQLEKIIEGAVRPPGRGVYIAVKIGLEWSIALVLLVLTAPLMAAIAVLVKLTSHGPAFYLQTRLGRNGKTYLICKLRTMEHNCEARTGPVWASKGDARITPLGSVLRHTHLDELPQLWNVLRGEMSLIGPRPERPEIVSRIERDVPDYRHRLAVRPGVTGLAQMRLPPDSDIEGVRLKLAHDLYYIKNLTPMLDFRIAVSTAFYFLGAAANAVCSAAVGRYGKAVVRDFDAETEVA